MTRLFSLLFLFLSLLPSLSAQTMVPWLSRGNGGSGWNDKETRLSQDVVRNQGVRLAVKIPVYGDARGMEAQPLVVPRVPTIRGSHDLMVLPSDANVIRGVDASSGADIWDVTLPGMPVRSTDRIDFHSTNDHFGCMSTGVADPETNRLYQSCWISTDGTPATARYKMFVISLTDGKLLTPNGVDLQGPDNSFWKQRASLVMIRPQGVKTVLVLHGSVYETGGGYKGYTGGVIAFDAASNTVAATLPMSAGIWMGGGIAPCNADQDCYFVTGNGDFDPTQGWFGESTVKVHYDPRLKRLSIVDYFSPWTDYQRTGQRRVPAGKIAGDSMPTEAVKPVGASMSVPLKDATLVAVRDERGAPSVVVIPKMASGPFGDQDWGSAPPAYFQALDVVLVVGKDGNAYAMRAAHLGKTTTATVGTKANCALLAIYPFWATASAGSFDPCPADPKALNILPQNGYTIHEHGQPIQFYDPLLKSYAMVLGGENSRVHKWALTANSATYIAEGHEYASEWLRGRPPGGMTGAQCAGSSNGREPNSYLVVCTIPYDDSNARDAPGHIVIYDPVHITADGYMPTLWDSGWFGAQDPRSEWYMIFNKFDPPQINGGEIIVSTFDGRVFLIR